MEKDRGHLAPVLKIPIRSLVSLGFVLLVLDVVFDAPAASGSLFFLHGVRGCVFLAAPGGFIQVVADVVLGISGALASFALGHASLLSLAGRRRRHNRFYATTGVMGNRVVAELRYMCFVWGNKVVG